MSETASQIAILCIVLLALAIAYWMGRNRTAKARLGIGSVSLLIAILLGTWARTNTNAPMLNVEASAYAFLTVFMVFLVTGVCLPIWALHDALISKISKLFER